MHRIIYVACFVLCSLVFGMAVAGTIYTWTDADGVKRYSNSQPPEYARDVQTIEEVDTSQQGDDLQRQEFDRMAEEAGKEADRHFEEQAEKKAQEAEADRQQQLEDQNQRIEEELSKLQKEIDDLKGRGLGPTFSAGMRDNQINLVQKKIDLLESDPDAYFKK